MPTVFIWALVAAAVIILIVMVFKFSRPADGNGLRSSHDRNAAPRPRTSYFIRWVTHAQKEILQDHGVKYTECNLGAIRREIAEAAAAEAAAQAAAAAAEAEAARLAALTPVGSESTDDAPASSLTAAASETTAAPAVAVDSEPDPTPAPVVHAPLDPDEDGIMLDERAFEDAVEVLSCDVAANFATDVVLSTGPLNEVVIYTSPSGGGSAYGITVPKQMDKRKAVSSITTAILSETLQTDIELRFADASPAGFDGRFRVYFNSAFGAAKNAVKTQAPEKVWGLTIGNGQEQAYKPSGQGTAFLTADGFALAELVGFNFFIHFDPFSADSVQGAGLYARLLQKLHSELTLERLLDTVVNASGVPLVENTGQWRTTVSAMPNDHVGRIAETMRIVSDKMLVEHLGNNVRISHAGSKAIAPADLRPREAFHIVLCSSPLGRVNCAPPQTLFGFDTEHRDKQRAFSVTGMGIPIVEDGGFIIGELFSDTLYVHYDVMRKGSLQEARIFVRLLAAASAALTKSLLPPDQRDLASLKRFVNACLELAMPLAVPGNNCDAVTLANSQRSVHDTLLQVRADEHALFQMEAAPDEELGREFDRLLDIANVLDVKVNDRKLIVTTDVLYCRNPDTDDLHEIGAFDIHIPTEGGDIRWFNKTRKVDAYQEDMMAPHIFSDGRACLGNVQDLFPRLISQRDYSTCVQLAIAFVEAVNTDDSAGSHIDSWPIARGVS